jgi:fatty acid desaturase
MSIATLLPAERDLPHADVDRIAIIREGIIAVGDRWRAKHPAITRHQNAVGLTIFVVSTLGVVGDAVLYATGAIPWYVCVPLTAFWLSLLHELEHDLIHWMYFRNRRWVHQIMMFGVWLLRPSTINPWFRRELHLHHHKVSGTESDLEERALTNGERWNGGRLVTLLDIVIGKYARPWRTKEIARAWVREVASSREDARALIKRAKASYLPLGAVHYGLWHLYLLLHGYQLVGGYIPNGWAYHALNVVAVVLLAPNALRTFCLHFVSSNMHYYGDIEAHNVLKQTQVWTAKWLWPLHAFCFNFGGTHAIHHFVVRDPFYVREAISHDCRQILRQNGVRFNDFGTFKRANRWEIIVGADDGHED